MPKDNKYLHCLHYNAMSMAIILITCHPDHERTVVKEIRKLDEISNAQLVYGQYDCIAKTKDDISSKDISTMITEKIRKLDGVRATATLNVVKIN